MSVAKNLLAGRILEEQLFPYPSLRDKDREVLGAMLDAEGKGFKVAMAILNNGRTGLGGGAVGGMKALIALASHQAQARKQFEQSIGEFGLVRDKILTPLPRALRDAAAVYERYTVELAKACDFLLRKHGTSIAHRQHVLKRVADIAIDLFVGLRALSRAAALSGSPRDSGMQAAAIAGIFAQQAKRRMANNVRRIERNEDEEMNSLASFIMDKGSYPWDVVS